MNTYAYTRYMERHKIHATWNDTKVMHSQDLVKHNDFRNKAQLTRTSE